VEGYIKRQAVHQRILPAEKPGNQDEMGGAADGQEFGQTLEDAEEKGLKRDGGEAHRLPFFSFINPDRMKKNLIHHQWDSLLSIIFIIGGEGEKVKEYFLLEHLT